MTGSHEHEHEHEHQDEHGVRDVACAIAHGDIPPRPATATGGSSGPSWRCSWRTSQPMGMQ